jgi:hypothetical protein
MYLGPKGKRKLLKGIKKPVIPPVTLRGLQNTWRFASLVHGHLAWVTLVKTVRGRVAI